MVFKSINQQACGSVQTRLGPFDITGSEPKNMAEEGFLANVVSRRGAAQQISRTARRVDERSGCFRLTPKIVLDKRVLERHAATKGIAPACLRSVMTIALQQGWVLTLCPMGTALGLVTGEEVNSMTNLTPSGADGRSMSLLL